MENGNRSIANTQKKVSVERDNKSQKDIVSIEQSVSYKDGVGLVSLPGANELAAYEQFVPGATERILVMAEKEQAHRHQVESKSLVLYKQGRYASIFVVVMMVFVACFLAVLGMQNAIIALFGMIAASGLFSLLMNGKGKSE